MAVNKAEREPDAKENIEIIFNVIQPKSNNVICVSLVPEIFKKSRLIH